jgi:hypothetical protein
VSLPVVAIGILLVTIGFFGAHAVASGWVGRLAGDAKGHASSLYLLSYYMGSSFVGSAGGWFWQVAWLGRGGRADQCAGNDRGGPWPFHRAGMTPGFTETADDDGEKIAVHLIHSSDLCAQLLQAE